MTIPRGKVTDFGDLLHIETWIVKGRKHWHVIWHVGATIDTTDADRVPRGVIQPPTGKVDLFMDLMADKKVPLSLGWTDEIGNPVAAPDGATATYSVDDSTIIALTDNGDGTAVAAATGVLGSANVHVAVDLNGEAFSGDLAINVVAGLAERVAIVAGAPEEVTPDV